MYVVTFGGGGWVLFSNTDCCYHVVMATHLSFVIVRVSNH